MKSKRLGRGLNALIPSESPTDGDIKGSDSQEIDVVSIETNPRQPRVVFNQITFQELKNSIEQNGVLQPILVRPINNGKYQVVAGERRFKATCELGLKTIPARIKEIDTEEEVLQIQIIENVQRDDLNPIDLANGYQRLIEEFNLTQEETAKKVGKDRTTISNTLRLLKLPTDIQTSLQQGKIKEGHARALLAIPDPKIQKEIWRKTLKHSMSVRKVEQLVKKYQTKQTGDQDVETSTKPRKSTFISRMESKLREKFGTQVKIRKRKEAGSIEISFYSPEDFQRLMDIFDQIKY